MIDKIIEELESRKYNDILLEHKRYNHAINDTIEIVKKYDNDGWIDAKDKNNRPKDCEDVLVNGKIEKCEKLKPVYIKRGS